MNKVLISDYDQTFYINDEDIEKNKKAVKEFREKGNTFIFATGRSYFDFKNKVNQYNLEYDYAIINHGATIIDGQDNVISNFSINNEIIENIKNDLQLEKTIENFWCRKLESRVNDAYKDITKINVRYNSKKEAANMNEKINKKYSNFVNSYQVAELVVEIISNEINKSKAISILLNKLGLKKENAYTIGDGYSDIKMVEDFNGYAMKKSVDELKIVAKKECNSVSELINDMRREKNEK